MKVLIASGGNLAGWKEVTCVLGKRREKSRTSLKILQEEIKPERTIIVSLDTLAEKGENYKEVKANAEEKIKGYADEFGLEDYEILIAPGAGTFPNGIFTGNALDYYYYILPKISLKLLKNSESTLDVYYSRSEAPGDWFEPNPIFFLTVKRGITFNFWIGERGKESRNLLKKAKELLIKSLSEIGVGAKTSVGYGRFEVIK